MAMAMIRACFSSPDLSPIFRQETTTTSSGKPKQNPVSKRLAVSTEQISNAAMTKTTSRGRNFVEDKSKSSSKEAETLKRVDVEEYHPEAEQSEGNRKSLKDYFDEAKYMIRSDGGPPRWFSPLECGVHSPDSPPLLYLPGLSLSFPLFLLLFHFLFPNQKKKSHTHTLF